MEELTKEIVERALKNGDVDYNPRGSLSKIDPVSARNLILRHIANEESDPEVDLSLVFD